MLQDQIVQCLVPAQDNELEYNVNLTFEIFDAFFLNNYIQYQRIRISRVQLTNTHHSLHGIHH